MGATETIVGYVGRILGSVCMAQKGVGAMFCRTTFY
jgi:hypothetical protein